MRKRKKNDKIDEIRILDEKLYSLVKLLEEKGFYNKTRNGMLKLKEDW